MNREIQEQIAVCEYLKMQYPNVVFMSDLSGVRLPIGIAKKIKNMKSSRGIPDIIILHPKGDYYHGLAIQLKATGEKVYKQNGDLYADEHLAEQSKVLDRLSELGYKARFCIGKDQAIEVIDTYLKK